MRKLRIGIAVGTALVALLLLIAVFVDFNVPASVRQMVDQAATEAGIDLAAESFVFNVFSGIRLEDVVATTAIPAATVTTTLDTVVLDHRLLPLLLGNVVVDRLVLESPVIVVATEPAATNPELAGGGTAPKAPLPRRRSGGEPAGNDGASTTPPAQRTSSTNATRPVLPVAFGGQEPTASTAGSASLGDPVTVHSASITNGTLLLQTIGEPAPHTTVSGLNVEIVDIFVDPDAGPIAVSLSASGHLDVGEVVYGDRRARGNRARLAADRGVYTVEGLGLTGNEGGASLDALVVDLRNDPYTYRTELSGKDIDLNLLLGVAGEPTLGAAQLEISAAGAGSETKSIVGGGTLRLAPGTVPDVPALQQADRFLAKPIAGQPYEATTIDFRIVDDHVEIAPFDLRAEMLRLSAEGRILVDGTLDLRSRIAIHRDLVALGDQQESIVKFVDALTDDDGWVSIPMLVRGTIEEPRVAPDTVALFAVLRESGVNLGQLMQALVRRNP